MTAEPSVDVVIVTWNHGHWLDECLRSVALVRQQGFAMGRVVVVDNASRLAHRPEARGLDRVTVLTNRENRGFAAACNQGAARGTADYILFLNPDTRLEPDAIAAAVALFERPASAAVGLVGLRLVNEQGVVQRTCGRFPTPVNVACQVLGLSTLAPAWLRGLRMTEWDHRDTREVDFACGACLVVRRAVFERLNGFDERLFLYLEDADLARRAHVEGWRIVFCARAGAVHTSGWASGRDRAWRLAQSWRSLLVYAWMHFTTVGAAGVTAIIVLCAPLPRLGQAAVHRSWPAARDTARAWLTLVRLAARRLLASGRDRGVSAASPATGRASQSLPRE